VSDRPMRVQFIRTDGNLSYAQSKGLAERFGRLPTKKEIIRAVNFSESRNDTGSNTFASFDLWVPVSDVFNEWVSIGNYDPNRKV
jgi:hypothetical protein